MYFVSLYFYRDAFMHNTMHVRPCCTVWYAHCSTIQYRRV